MDWRHSSLGFRQLNRCDPLCRPSVGLSVGHCFAFKLNRNYCDYRSSHAISGHHISYLTPLEVDVCSDRPIVQRLNRPIVVSERRFGYFDLTFNSNTERVKCCEVRPTLRWVRVRLSPVIHSTAETERSIAVKWLKAIWLLTHLNPFALTGGNLIESFNLN